MKTRHLLALSFSAFCLILAFMCTVSFILGCIDYNNIDPEAFGSTLSMIIIGISTHFVWVIGMVNAAMGTILPLSALKKYGKYINAIAISFSALNGAILLTLVICRYIIFQF